MFKTKKGQKEKVFIPISYYKNIINENTKELESLLENFDISDSILEFLNNPCSDYSYNSPTYKNAINELHTLKITNKNIFISFLGVTKNNDCIDNFGHSRLLRTVETKKKNIYNLHNRPWYIEALGKNSPITISTPYLAESGSYVMSVLRKIYNKNNELVGILGIDVLFSSIAKLKNGDNIIIFMNDGTILYNSHPKLKYIIEKQNNLLYMINYPAFQTMLSQEYGLINDRFCSKIQDIEFTNLFDERFVLLKTEKILIE